MPVAVSYPGVYVNEKPSGTRAIAGVGTSVTAFLGMAGQGPMFSPEFIGSFADFERTYGGETDGELANQVFQFFVNGGTRPTWCASPTTPLKPMSCCAPKRRRHATHCA